MWIRITLLATALGRILLILSLWVLGRILPSTPPLSSHQKQKTSSRSDGASQGLHHFFSLKSKKPSPIRVAGPCSDGASQGLHHFFSLKSKKPSPIREEGFLQYGKNGGPPESRTRYQVIKSHLLYQMS